MAPCRIGVPLVLLLVAVASAQNPPQSDPQAVSLVSQSITALTGGTSISDVTLTGTANWSNGTDNETASATLMAKGTGESRFDMALGAGSRSEIRNDGSSTFLGETLAPDGTVHPWSVGNCLVNATWFFPPLSVLGATGDPTLIFVYVGLESHNGIPVQHIQSYRYALQSTATTRQLSTMDIYLDAVSFLPSAFVFNTLPDRGAIQNIQVEVDFLNYKSVNGVQVPFHIQRFVAGTLNVDFSLTNAQFNSGLSDSLFAIR